MLKARKAFAQSRLDEMEKVHNNSYQFLLRLAHFCTVILMGAFAMVAIYAVSRSKPTPDGSPNQNHTQPSSQAHHDERKEENANEELIRT